MECFHQHAFSVIDFRVVDDRLIAVRGERDALVLSQDSLSRLSYNPFYA